MGGGKSHGGFYLSPQGRGGEIHKIPLNQINDSASVIYHVRLKYLSRR